MEYRRIDGNLIKKTQEEWEAIDEANKPEPTYAEKRIEAYGSIGSQLDEIYRDIEAWKARIAQVKLDNPKE